jgi:hypothetical protein
MAKHTLRGARGATGLGRGHYFTDRLALMRLTDMLAALEAVPTPAGDGWRVFIQWVNGRMQYVSGFESLQEAEDWIMNESEHWLRALMKAQL